MQLSLSALDWIVFIVLSAGSLLFGLWFSRRKHAVQNSSNFFLGGRTMPWYIVGASMFATNIGAEHLVGLSGDSYRYGLCAGTVELTAAICIGFACVSLYPYYIKNKVFTIPEFLEMRYDRLARSFFSGLMLVICIMTKMAFTLFAGALVLNSLFHLNMVAMLFIIAGITAIVIMIGGFKAVAGMDSIQTIIMIAGGCCMLFIGLDLVGGWSALIQKAPLAMHIAKPYDDTSYPFWGIILGACFGGTFYWGVDQVNVQRVLGAKDMQQARWGAMFAILLKLTPIFIFALPGVIAAVLYPGMSAEESKSTFVFLLNNLLPVGYRGIVFASLISALISSAAGVMNSVSTLFVRDFVLVYKPDISENKQVWVGRLAIIVATVLGIAAAILIWQTPDGIYKYLQAISIYLTTPIVPAIIIGIMSKKVTRKGAVASVLVGTVIATIFVIDQLAGQEFGEKYLPFLHHKLTLNYTYRGFWGFLITTATLLIVSAYTPKTSTEKLEKTTINWKQKAESFSGITDWRLHLTILLVITILIYYWLW